MKKFFILLSALIISIVSFTACEKTVKEEPNPLVGTKWFASYSDYLMVLEFTSDTQVTGYFAKDNGAYYTGQTSGTYKVSGNSVTFSGLTYRWIYGSPARFRGKSSKDLT